MFPRCRSIAPRRPGVDKMVARRRMRAVTAALVVLCAAFCAAQQGAVDIDPLSVVGLAGPSSVRSVYFVRHGEAFKNTCAKLRVDAGEACLLTLHHTHHIGSTTQIPTGQTWTA